MADASMTDRTDVYQFTDQQLREFDAVRRTTDALKGEPSFLLRSYYRDPDIGPLVRRGLISWERHPVMSRNFAAIRITDKGRAVLAKRVGEAAMTDQGASPGPKAFRRKHRSGTGYLALGGSLGSRGVPKNIAESKE